MRFETESYSVSPIEGSVVEASVPNYDREANEALKDGVKAAQAGDRAAARTALLRATELDPSSESAWLWLASISEYPEELLVFLNNVLDINPYNQRATEWMAATRSLLAKTFVQRGIDAANGGQTDLAAQCMNQALENDHSCADAWLWLAKLSDTVDGKLTYLEKVLEYEPDNHEARREYEEAKHAVNQSLLAEARSAAVAGSKGQANDLLDAFIAENPESEDGWILRSHLADSFGDKVAAFEKVLEINPENLTAKSGVESLRAIMATVAPAAEEPKADSHEVMENTAFVLHAERSSEHEEVHHKSPTQDLEFPAAAAEFHHRMTSESVSLSENQPEPEASFEPLSERDEPRFEAPAVEELRFETPVFEEPKFEAPPVEDLRFEAPVADEPALENSAVEDPKMEAPAEDSNWGMNTIAFSFAFPGGDLAEPVLESAEEQEQPESVDLADSSNDELYETAEYEPVPSPAVMAEEFQPVPVPGSDLPFEQPAVRSEAEDEIPVTEEFDASQFSFQVPSEPVSYNGDYSSADNDMEMDAEYAIPIPEVPAVEAFVKTGFETRIVRSEPLGSSSGVANCPFCSEENPAQAFTCGNCLATLSLSDLEMLLANSHADRDLLRNAVRELDAVRESRPLSEAELTNLGIAYLNLRDFPTGYQYLYEASQLNPNNVVLGGQVNSLLIRLDEIKRQEEAFDAMPKEKKILVVDDSPTVRKLIAGKLEKCGHEVYCAADGVEAIEQLDTMVPDLILLDITMPRMDGYQVCKVIRSKDATKDVPVVMISGKDGFFDKVRGRMAGTTGYITKPFGPETLMKAVETYLKGEVL